jgi:LTXXQ motif family protein
MLKATFGAMSVILAATAIPTHAQNTAAVAPTQESEGLSQSDLKAITDARIGIVKAALQLTPEQEKYWPALEQAIRDRAQARQQRMAALYIVLNQEQEVDLFKLLKGRADALSQKAATLERLAAAWQPLYQSLNDDQKRRMRFVVVNLLPAVRDAFETREMDEYDETPDNQ